MCEGYRYSVRLPLQCEAAASWGAVTRMVFWKKKSTPEDAPSAGARAGSLNKVPAHGAAQYADAALDTAVGMLRALGRYAFDLTGVDAETFRRRCEAWAEHLAIGAPHPERS